MPERPKKRLITRRRLLIAGGTAIVGGAALGGYAFGVEPHWIETVELDMPIAGLPEELVGKRLVQISDLHIGPIVDEHYITAAIEQATSLDPDFLVITGDFMTCKGDEQLDQARRVLANFQPARLGTFGVLGNHDYGRNWRQHEVAGTFSEIATDAGIDVLRNETREVAGLSFVGMDDLWSGELSVRAALEPIEDGRPGVVLCHNPDAADLAGWSKFHGWILCGHTHGGQCKPPWCAAPRLPVRNRRYNRGQIELADGRTMYINRGLGYLLRVRFNARPEITVFTLSRASA